MGDLTMSDELKVLFPGREVIVGGETIAVKPFKMGQYPKVIEIIADIAPLIAQADGNMMTIATLGAEQVMRLAAISTGKKREWFDNVEADEGLVLLTAVLEENWKFFQKKVKPELDKAFAVIKALQAPAAVDGEHSTQD
jgi:hypothetical protein